MKIRSHVTLMAVILTLIPLLLLGLGISLWVINRSQEPLPAYSELPRGSELLTDQTTWDKIRDVLKNRPGKAHIFVFSQNFALIYGSTPLPPDTPNGAMDLEEGIRRLQAAPVPLDIFLFQPAETKVWIVMVQEMGSGGLNAPQNTLIGVGVALLAVLILSIGLSLYLGRSLAQSIVRLEKAAQRVARGDLAFSVELKGTDEVVSLGRAFEKMRLALLEEDARQSRFVMGVSHDLKSPLALIKGYVELLKDGPPATAEAREAHFELILDKADQLDSMIDHLIDYSKVNTGDWQQTWKPLVLRPFLEEFCSSLGPDARLLGRTMVAELAIDEDWSVDCDARSIRRSLENLVHNALRYTPEGGTVGVRARERNGSVEIEVWDDGPGLSAEDLPHLFEQFYRGTHSRRESGMGLGLSIVKTILDSHGWSIRAESDRGARFIVGIPAASNPLSKSANMGVP